MKLGPREIIFLLVLTAVPVGAWFFVFEPRNQEIAQSRRTISAMETTLARLDQLTKADDPTVAKYSAGLHTLA